MKKIALIASCLGIASVSVFLLLCRDDAQVLVPTDIRLYAVQPEGNEESFDILIGVLREERLYQDLSTELLRKDNIEDGYRDLLLNNSDLIIQNYSVAKEVLRELRALDSFEAIGDTSSSYDSEIVKFRSIRDLLQAVCFYTELSYIEDSKEKDLDELLQFHSIASNWLPYARTLAHSMISIVMLDRIRDTLLFVEPYLGPEEVQQVLTAYSDIPDYSRSIENALYSEYCMTASALDGILAEGKGGLGFLLFKRNRTLNIYGSFLEEQISSARVQDWDAMSKRSASLENDFKRIHLTNWGGWAFLSMTIPAINCVMQQAHESHLKDVELVKNYNNLEVKTFSKNKK